MLSESGKYYLFPLADRLQDAMKLLRQAAEAVATPSRSQRRIQTRGVVEVSCAAVGEILSSCVDIRQYL